MDPLYNSIDILGDPRTGRERSRSRRRGTRERFRGRKRRERSACGTRSAVERDDGDNTMVVMIVQDERTADFDGRRVRTIVRRKRWI